MVCAVRGAMFSNERAVTSVTLCPSRVLRVLRDANSKYLANLSRPVFIL